MPDNQEVETVKEYIVNNVKYKVQRSFSDDGINLEEAIVNYLMNEIEKN